ncbi:DUF4442 domain-containing protein [Ekhidna sp.]|uniref:DUF4442 domain-containing protein n=1 Tax=Ekhidna sp. TaxID=2608089 RepID=UPI003B502ACC
MYQFLSRISNKYFSKYGHKLFKWFFNLSPMYRRTTGKITRVTPDFLRIDVKIPISYKNKNYVGTIFGGSLFAATDPLYMVQLIQILGRDYVVWDKSSTIKFKRPANADAYTVFEFSEEEIEDLKSEVSQKHEIELFKSVHLKSKEGTLFCEIEKVIYIADKEFYKQKKKTRSKS